MPLRHPKGQSLLIFLLFFLLLLLLLLLNAILFHLAHQQGDLLGDLHLHVPQTLQTIFPHGSAMQGGQNLHSPLRHVLFWIILQRHKQRLVSTPNMSALNSFQFTHFGTLVRWYSVSKALRTRALTAAFLAKTSK